MEKNRCPHCKGFETKYVFSDRLRVYAIYCYDCDRINLIEYGDDE